MFLKKMILFVYLLLFLCMSFHVCAGESNKTILFLPFINKGSYVYDRLKTHIPNYLYEPIKMLPGYNAIPFSKIHQYMVQKGYKEQDLNRYATITSISENFNADFIIHGYYFDKDNIINISFNIFRCIDNDLENYPEFKSVKLENLNALALNETFDELIQVCEKVTEQKLNPGFLTIFTNPGCSLFIDKEPAGSTPVRLPLAEGKHKITLVYDNHSKEEIILDEEVEIKQGDSYSKNIGILVPLEIDAEEKCTVYINKEDKGTTPFTTKLFWGRVYLVEVMYQNNGTEHTLVYADVINTKESVPPLYFPSKGSIELDFPDTYKAKIEEQSPVELPYTYNYLVPGTYRLQIILNDTDWKKEWPVYDTSLVLLPFQTITFDADSLNYKNKWGLALLPSTLQFYNRQPGKGTAVLSLFAGSALLAGFSGIMWNHYSKKFDDELIKLEQDENDWTNAESTLMNNLLNKKNLYSILTISGIVAGALIYTYSAVDGTVTMNHLYNLIY